MKNLQTNRRTDRRRKKEVSNVNLSYQLRCTICTTDVNLVNMKILQTNGLTDGGINVISKVKLSYQLG